MGSNGAGKTTLFNLISGFIKPQKGEIFFGGKNLSNHEPYKINRQGIGRTFQDLRLITKLSVKENIVLAMQHNPTDSWLGSMLPKRFLASKDLTRIAQMNTNAGEIIGQFFLQDIQHSLAGEISYGQQKLLSLACCVANGASLLLLDEPVAGIQPEYRKQMAALIKSLKTNGKTILLIEHNTEFLEEVADQIFFLHDGEINTFETMEMMRKDERVMEAYM